MKDAVAKERAQVEVMAYVVYPSDYTLLPHVDKDCWLLYVVWSGGNDWSVRRFPQGQQALSLRGTWVLESSHSNNSERRYPLSEALDLALTFVDNLKINGLSAGDAAARYLMESGA